MLLQPLELLPSFCVQDKQQSNTGSVRHVAHRILLPPSRRITGITITGATITIIDHVAFIRNDHHCVILGSEGPN